MSTYDAMNERTRKQIQSSFLSLLKEKDFTKITVRDITTEATINRGTFYLHYLDKYDLLEQIEEQLLQQFTTQLQQASPTEILFLMKEQPIPDYSIRLFEFMADYAEPLKILLGSNNHSRFHLRLRSFLVEQFLVKYEADLSHKSDPTIPKEYLAAFAASALLGLIEQWLSDPTIRTPQAVAEIYMKIITFIKEV